MSEEVSKAIPYEQYRTMQDDPNFRRHSFRDALKLFARYNSVPSPSKRGTVRGLGSNINIIKEKAETRILLPAEELKPYEISGRKGFAINSFYIDNPVIRICSDNPVKTLHELVEAIKRGDVFGEPINLSGGEEEGTHENNYIAGSYFTRGEDSKRLRSLLGTKGFSFELYSRGEGYNLASRTFDPRLQGIPPKAEKTLKSSEFQIRFFNDEFAWKPMERLADYLTKKGETFVLMGAKDWRVYCYNLGKDDGSTSRGSQQDLEKRVGGVTAIIGLVGAIFFLSSNLTGNVIGLNQSNSNIMGVILFLVGLTGAFFYFRKRKS